jgi:hypothetical protein
MSILGVGEAIGGVATGVGGVAQGIGGVARGLGPAFAKLSDVILSPVKMLCNWAEEPLRKAEHIRQEEIKDKDVHRDIERQVGVGKALSNQKMLEEEHSAKMHIQRETEIVRILVEIEEFKKEKEFERMKSVSDAIMQYQRELVKINIEVVDAIGSMRIELQRKAYDLIHEKSIQFDEFQGRAIQQAQDQLNQIDMSSTMSDSTRRILTNGVEKRLTTVIEGAVKFIEQLNMDMQLISKDINLITLSGQNFIERHLDKFQLAGFNDQSLTLLSTNDPIQIARS